MSTTVDCPSCGKGLRVPESAAGRRVMCPRCDETVKVPEAEALPDEGAVAQPSEPTLGETLRTPEGLGAASIFFGVLSVPVMILPFVGYAALASSAFGFLLGLAGLMRLWLGVRDTGGVPVLEGEIVGVRPRRFPIAGTAVSLVTFFLALLPHLPAG